jgi:hypothetical protein
MGQQRETAMTAPKPQQYNDITAFEDAYVAWSLRDCPAIPERVGFDATPEHWAALSLRYETEDAARNRAFELWDEYMENAAIQYEQGIGPAWDC